MSKIDIHYCLFSKKSPRHFSVANAQLYFIWLEFHGTKDYSIEKIHKFLKAFSN